MNIFDFANLRDAPPNAVTLIHVVVILLFAWLLFRISRKLIHTFRVHMGGELLRLKIFVVLILWHMYLAMCLAH